MEGTDITNHTSHYDESATSLNSATDFNPSSSPNADFSGSWEFVEANHIPHEVIDPCAGCFFTASETLVETVINQTDGTWQGMATIPITLAFFDPTPTPVDNWAHVSIFIGGCGAVSNLLGTVNGNTVTFILTEGDGRISGFRNGQSRWHDIGQLHGYKLFARSWWHLRSASHCGHQWITRTGCLRRRELPSVADSGTGGF